MTTPGSSSPVTYPPVPGNYVYPFDPTGEATTNKITGEVQTLSPGAQSDYFFIIPQAAPYFRESLRVFNRTTNQDMVEGVDYLCTHKFMDATWSIGEPIYGSIMMMNRAQAGVVNLDYQSIGGAWTVDQQTIMLLLANTTSNPAITSWDEIQFLPYQFPPVNHEFDLIDLKGTEDVIDAINGLTNAVTGTYARVAGDTLPIKGNNLVGGAQIDILMSDNLNYYIFQLADSVANISIDNPVLSPGQVRRIEICLLQLVGGTEVTWADNIRWAHGTAPQLSDSEGDFDVVVLVYPDVDTGWLGYLISNAPTGV